MKTTVFLADNASKQTYTFGEIFLLLSVVAPSTFTGPVDAVVGEFDWIFHERQCPLPLQPSSPCSASSLPEREQG
jgi:hypothetical protein